MADDYEEKDLISRIVDGDRKAFSILYRRHLQSVYRFIFLFSKSKEVSEDIAQKVFVNIWEKRQKLTGINCFKPYIFRCAKNLLLDEIRRMQTENRIFLDIKPASEESDEKSDNMLIFSEYSKIVDDAIELLPAKRRQIVKLRTQKDLTLDEISAELCISKPVVKKQLYAGNILDRLGLFRKIRGMSSVSYMFTSNETINPCISLQGNQWCPSSAS